MHIAHEYLRELLHVAIESTAIFGHANQQQNVHHRFNDLPLAGSLN